MARAEIGVLLLVVAFGAAAEIPDRLYDSRDSADRPIWISETSLNEAMEALDVPVGSRLAAVDDLVRVQVLSTLLSDYSDQERSFELEEDGSLKSCDPWRYSVFHDQRGSSIRELVELSEAIVSVRAVDSKQGILFSKPRQLIEVELLSVIKDAEGIPEGGFYLSDFFTRMVIDGQGVCLGENPVPIGGEFVLFLSNAEPALVPLPVYSLDSSALISGDGSSHGALFNDYSGDSPEELALQLQRIDELVARP